MNSVKEIVLEKIEAVGADGLCHPKYGCHCKKDFLFEDCELCDKGYAWMSCVLAKAVLKRDYCKTQDCDECNEEDCYDFNDLDNTDAKRYVPMEVRREIKTS
jgi:hypothetical protein